jgi:hypothetical protein
MYPADGGSSFCSDDGVKGFFESSICLHQNTRLHIPDFNNLLTHSPGDLKFRISVLSSYERQIFQAISSHNVFG